MGSDWIQEKTIKHQKLEILCERQEPPPLIASRGSGRL